MKKKNVYLVFGLPMSIFTWILGICLNENDITLSSFFSLHAFVRYLITAVIFIGGSYVFSKILKSD